MTRKKLHVAGGAAAGGHPGFGTDRDPRHAPATGSPSQTTMSRPSSARPGGLRYRNPPPQRPGAARSGRNRTPGFFIIKRYAGRKSRAQTRTRPLRGCRGQRRRRRQDAPLHLAAHARLLGQDLSRADGCLAARPERAAALEHRGRPARRVDGYRPEVPPAWPSRGPQTARSSPPRAGASRNPSTSPPSRPAIRRTPRPCSSSSSTTPEGAFYYGTEDRRGCGKTYAAQCTRGEVLFSDAIPASAGWTREGTFRLPWESLTGYTPAGWEDAVVRWYRPSPTPPSGVRRGSPTATSPSGATTPTPGSAAATSPKTRSTP